MGTTGSKREPREEGNQSEGSEKNFSPTTQRRKTGADFEGEFQRAFKTTRPAMKKTQNDSGDLTPTSSGRLSRMSSLSSRLFISSRTLKTDNAKPEANEATEDNPVIEEEDTYFTSDDGTRTYPRTRAKVQFLEAVKKSKLLGNTSASLREELFEQACVPVFVNAGDILFEQNTNGHLLFVLIEGEYESSAKKGKKKPKRISVEAGQVVAEYCVLMSSPHEYTLEAKKDGFILAVHRVQYQMTTVLFADRERTDKREGRVGDDQSDLNLSSIPLLASLNKAQLDLAQKSLKEMNFAAKQWLVASRQIVPGLFIIKSGQVAVRAPRIPKTTEEQKLIPTVSSASFTKRAPGQPVFTEAENDEIEWLTRGDYFGEAALLSDDAQLGVDVICSSEKGVTVLMLSREDWKNILKETSVPDDFLDTIKRIHVTRLMSRSPAFSNVDEGQLQTLASTLEFKEFKAGERIVEGGSPVTEEGGMYLVTQGAVRLFPYNGLKPTNSQVELERRVMMLRENSRAIMMSRRNFNNASHSVLSQTSTSNASQEDLTRGASFNGLSPAMFGRQMTEVALMSGSSAQLLNPANQSGKTDNAPNSTTSLDHEALFLSLGMMDRKYVVLLAGELFGEEGISHVEKDRIARASVYAVGKVTAAYISRALLEQLHLVDAVSAGVLDETNSDARGSIINGASQRVSDEVLNRLDFARKMTQDYLNDEKLKSLELKVQRQSFRRANNGRGPAHRESLTFKMKSKRLYVIRDLHRTDSVHVALSMHDPSCQVLVVKELDIAAANKQGMGSYVLAEQTVLAQISSSFVANMISSWEEPEKLYLALEPALLGDLGNLLQLTVKEPAGTDMSPKKGELGGFEPDFLQFVAACVVLALKHLFEHQIIHRDIKPNNIVIDQFGYCKLVDFGISKRLAAGSYRTYTLCGSPKYMSPELVQLVFHGRGNPYTNAVDWWAFGMSLVELATGSLPYFDHVKIKHMSDRDRNQEALLQVDHYCRDVTAASRAARELGHEYSVYESHIWFKPFRNSKDEMWNKFGQFVGKLLLPDSDVRLGAATSSRGPREAQDQAFFKGMQFDRIAKKKAIAPFIPKRYLVDLKDAEQKARALQYPTLEKMSKKKTAAGAKERPKHPGMLQRANVENRVRANLENPDTNNAKMSEALQSSDQARKQTIMARDQHIRRIAFKQGVSLDELDSTVGSRLQNNLVVLQRAAVLETLQVLMQTGSLKSRRDMAALRIQTCWRAYKVRENVIAHIKDKSATAVKSADSPLESRLETTDVAPVEAPTTVPQETASEAPASGTVN